MHSATCPDYTQFDHPEAAYKNWKENWQPPKVMPKALYGRVIVEFSPYAHKSEAGIFTPEQASFQAIVIDDSTGELSCGTEVAVDTLDGTNYQHEGRTLSAIHIDGILAILD